MESGIHLIQNPKMCSFFYWSFIKACESRKRI